MKKKANILSSWSLILFPMKKELEFLEEMADFRVEAE